MENKFIASAIEEELGEARAYLATLFTVWNHGPTPN